MKNPGHKRSNSGYSQPSQSKYSQNSLLNTMIRVNKIGGVASNLDSSGLVNGNRPSISPYRKNSNSRETTPKTAISRSTVTQKNLSTNYISKTPPSQSFMNSKRLQSNFTSLNNNSLVNSVMKSVNTSKNNLINNIANSSNYNYNRNPLNNSSNNGNFFSKINNNVNKKNLNSITQKNFHKSLENSVSTNMSSNRSQNLNNLLGINKSNQIIKNGTKIVISNDMNQKKFEKNLKGKQNVNGVLDYSNSPINNNSLEKSSTSSLNSANDRIKVNKVQMNIQNPKVGKMNSSNNNNYNNSNNNTHHDVLSSLLNSKNYSKSPNKDVSPSQYNRNLNAYNDNKSPNNLNFFGKSGTYNQNLNSNNDVFNKLNNMNSLGRSNNFDQSTKQKEKTSKSPSPVNSSLNNLNLLTNLKKNSKLVGKNRNNLYSTNNVVAKKLNQMNISHSNNTNRMNNVAPKQKEVRGTIMEMNSDEFLNKITGKFGGISKENSSNFNSNIDSNLDNQRKKSESKISREENSLNFNNVSGNNSNNVSNHSGMNLNFSRDNKYSSKPNTSQGIKENINPSNKLGMSINSKNNLNNNLLMNNYSLNKNETSHKDLLNNLKLKNMQVSNHAMNSFKELSTSPFLKKKGALNDKNLGEKKPNLGSNLSNTLKPAFKGMETNFSDSRNMTPNQIKNSKIGNTQSLNNLVNHNLSLKESPMKNNKSVENIMIPPKKLKKKILYMNDITKIGCTGQNNKKVNQDNFFIYKNFCNDPHAIYFSVCDGHGVNGHDVSGYLKENLPTNVSKNIIKKNINVNAISASDPNFQTLIRETFINTNIQMATDIRVDTNFSGSTCVSLIYTPTRLITINVGDSRAVLGRCVNGVWKSHDLSNDHKPSEPNEAARIKKSGGRIEPYTDDNNEFIGPPRVWLKEDDIPGLAMTRSFGDKIANIVGVTCEPEITEWEFTPDDKFFIIASDGVWEFIESEECVNILKDFYLKSDHKGACEHLLKESSKRWMKEEDVIDDITMIVVFLE